MGSIAEIRYDWPGPARPEASVAEASIREAEPGDREFIGDLSREAFERFGDYETTLPPLLRVPWVHTLVCEVEGKPVGYAMVAVGMEAPREGEMVAIAVRREWQAQGLGKLLLERSEALVRALVPSPGPALLRLAVAVDNTVALAFFTRAGFVVADRRHGRYPAGQRSMAMVKKLK